MIVPPEIFDVAMQGSRWSPSRLSALRAYLVDQKTGDEIEAEFGMSRIQLSSAAVQVRAQIGDFLLTRDAVDLPILPLGAVKLTVIASLLQLEPIHALALQSLSDKPAGSYSVQLQNLSS